MKNPMFITIISFIASSILLFLMALIVDSQHAAGEQWGLTIIAYGIYYQSIFCYGIFILSSIIKRKWILKTTIVNKIIYGFFFVLMAYYLMFFLYLSRW